ncbi:MAG: TolC family outer membrane protein [Betaproteobacteria bacterium]|nr:TolC family outer membrane protein [Betaproteobacteria bacterium]
MKIKTSVVLIASLLAAPAWAVDLLGIYRDALSQDPVYASARAAFEAGKEAAPQARAGLLPSVSLDAAMNRNQRKLEGFSQSEFNSNSYTLRLTQPLFRMQNWIAFDQAGMQVQQAEAVFADASQNLIVRSSQAYFDVLLAQDNVNFSAAQKKAISEQLAQAKRNFEVGTATITDTYEAQAKYDLAVAKEIADLADLEIKKRALQQLIGKAPAALSPLVEKPVLATPSPVDMEEWVKASGEASPTVAQLRLASEIAKKEVDRAQAGHYPTVDLSASYGNSNSPASIVPPTGPNLDTRSGTLGLTLNIPIFSGGGTQSRVKQALANREKAAQDLENSVRTVAQTVRQNFLGVTNGVQQVKALEAALVSSKSSLDATVLGKDVGVRTNVDVLNAQQQLFQAQRDLQQARYNTILAQLRLKAASGRLKEDDLAEVNRLLAK